jgi:hypothetical protein
MKITRILSLLIWTDSFQFDNIHGFLNRFLSENDTLITYFQINVLFNYTERQYYYHLSYTFHIKWAKLIAKYISLLLLTKVVNLLIFRTKSYLLFMSRSNLFTKNLMKISLN